MMTAKQILMTLGAATISLAANPAHASGGVNVFFQIPLRPLRPIYVGQPIFVNPAPIYLNPIPVVFAPPVIVTPPPVVVVAPPVVVPAIADLAVTGYKISWVRDESGILKRMLVFEVRNLGTGSSTATLASASLGSAPTYLSVPALLPGQAASLMLETNGIVSPGTMVRIVVDPQNSLLELDKSNNVLVDRYVP